MKVLQLLFLALILCSQTAYAQTADTPSNGRDQPGAALDFEFNLTRDPITGKVPKENLIPIMEDMQLQFAAANHAPTIANWVERGPNNVAGRTRALLFDPNDATSKKVWAGAVDGGLWFTNNITLSSPVWTNVSSLWSNLAVSCIAASPLNTQVFYAGTGEGWFNADAVKGQGIWKTSNGGTTWSQLASTTGNSNFDYIQKIVVHPTTGAVLAATRGYYCNSGGLYRSVNEGVTWTKVLGTSTGACATSNTYAADIEVGADGTMYASMGIFNTGGIFKSTDAGLTWTSIGGNGFPTANFERIEIATAPSDANRIYAMVQNTNYTLMGIYTSSNKGASWTTCTLPTWVDNNCSLTSTDMTRGQAWYDMIIAVDPANASTLLIGGVDIFKSSNAGSSWTQLSSWWGGCSRPNVHADQHAMVYKPGSSSTVLFGNDGGVYYSSNMNISSPTFASRNSGYNVTQFYSCAIHPGCAQNYFIGGTQDNGTHQFTNSGMNSTARVYGGDGGFCFIDQETPSVQLTSYVYNNFYRTTNNWATNSQVVSSPTDGTVGSFINPADYDSKNHILYSSYSTSEISRASGMTNTTPNPAVQFSVTGMTDLATHLRVSPHSPLGTTTLFVGTKNGNIFKVSNAQGAATSVNISGTVAPWNTNASISCIEIGATENDLLVTFSNYGVISVWRTTNGGTTWLNKEGNLPDMPIRWAIYNPNNLNEVYLATELGIWSSDNIGLTTPTWVPNNNNLSNVRVDMLRYRMSDKELIAATHGRGLYSSNVFAAGSVPNSAFSVVNTSVCAGAPITFSDNSCNNPNAWSWTFSGGTPATSTLQNPVVTYNTSGTYSVSLTATNTNGSHTTTKINFITITASPAINTSVTAASICAGSSSTITASGYTSYNWQPGNLSGASIVVSPTSTTTYTVTGSNASGCTKSATRLITVNALPNVSASASLSTICAGASTTITANNANTYSWQPGALSGAAITVFPGSTTTYTVTGTSSSGCTKTATKLITVNALPNVSTTVTSSTICAGASTSITASNASTYTWLPGSLTGVTITVMPLVTTTYTVIGTGSNGCTKSSTRLITVNTAGNTTSSQTITSLLSYTWPINGATYTQSGTYTSTSLNVSGCIHTNTLVLSIVHLEIMIDQEISCAGNNDGSCQASGIAPYVFTSFTLDNSITNNTGYFLGLAPGVHTICASNGSITECNTVLFVAPPPLVVSLVAMSNITCSGMPGYALVDITGGTNNSGYTYYWTNSSGTQIANSLDLSTTIPGIYTFNVFDDHGCFKSYSVNFSAPTSCNSALSILCLLQGYWNGGNLSPVLENQGQVTSLGSCDTILVELHKSSPPYNMLFSQKTVLQQNGIADCIFPTANGSYYIVVKHRNALQTWSANPVVIGSGIVYYNFSNAASKAYGANQIMVAPNLYAFYSGDLNADENIDLGDFSLLELDINNFKFGYQYTDINGDGNVDLGDVPYLESNISQFIFSNHP